MVQVGFLLRGETAVNRPTKEALLRLQRLAKEASTRYPAELGVQFIFDVSGDVSTAKFHGVRRGPFRRLKNKPDVHFAVPEALEVPANQFLADSLEKGLRVANPDQLGGNSFVSLPTVSSEEFLLEFEDYQ